ncbi:MAG: cytochrome c oxidase subunit 3 [Myxococcota bacterium]
MDSSVLGMLIFVASEVMFFAGLVSGFTIVKSGAMVWPPPGQPRLPIEETAVNTAALLTSGVLLFLARRAFGRDQKRCSQFLIAAIGLGAFFVVFQGVEWVQLIHFGLTLTSSTLGSFFYLIVGIHALHAVIAIGLMLRIWLRLKRGGVAEGQFAATAIFWYFVVGLWPILYFRIYV